MRYSIILGAVALVAASPAPQAFDPQALNAAAPVLTQGPPVGVGPSAVTAYQQGAAQTKAAAAATGVASAQAAKRSLEERTFWPWSFQKAAPQPAAPAVTPAPAGPVPATPATTSTGYATTPSGCTPVDWTNTWAFTSDPACATAIEVGTYCGFINPLDPCAPQPKVGSNPQVTDTPESFLANQDYQNQAKNAKTPTGYKQSFVNLQGATTGSGYLSYKLLGSYDVNACSQFCDDTKTCTGFNIYIERDPAWNPEQCSCHDSETLVNYKCSIWGQDVTKDTATNGGQDRDGYKVVVTGSNGYNKGTYSPPTPPNCSKPTDCGGKLIDQPRYCMGQKTFPGPFDPSLCAAYAQAQNAINQKSGFFGMFLSMFGMNKGGCAQFQASYLEQSGIGYATHCRLFTKKFTPAQATLDISVGADSSWGCQKAYTWDVDVNASFNWGGWSKKA
jgi:hypothetical protein